MDMRQFTLKRISSTKHGTFGVLLDGDTQFAVTVEPPWKDNTPFISCIPAGWYICERHQSPKYGDTFLITNVPKRTFIVFHKGNWGAPHSLEKSDTEGCIVVAEQFENLDGVPAVRSSWKGFKEFLQRTNGINRFQFTIKDC